MNFSKMIRVSAFSLFAFSGTAHATIYIADAEPKTHSIGMAVISSGPVVTYDPAPMTGVKGVGFVGWSGLADNVDPRLNAKVFEMMRAGTPVDQIEKVVDQEIHHWYSRFMFISTNGTAGYVFPPNGCAQPECGVLVDPSHQFLVMGGGLEHDVVPKTVAAFSPIHADDRIPLECKMLIGLRTIIDAGGEIEEFAEAKIGVDRPGLPDQEIFTSTAGEKDIIADLGAQLAKAGYRCPAPLLRASRVRSAPKRRRNPHSRDL